MRLDCKTGLEGVQGRIRLHLGGIDIQLLPPDQSCLLTLLHNRLEKAEKDFNPIALTDTGQARMVRKWFTQVIANVPQNAESITRMAHQLPFGTNSLKEPDQLQLEEHDGINGGAATACIGLLHEIAYKREVEGALQVTIEVILRH